MTAGRLRKNSRSLVTTVNASVEQWGMSIQLKLRRE